MSWNVSGASRIPNTGPLLRRGSSENAQTPTPLERTESKTKKVCKKIFIAIVLIVVQTGIGFGIAGLPGAGIGLACGLVSAGLFLFCKREKSSGINEASSLLRREIITS